MSVCKNEGCSKKFRATHHTLLHRPEKMQNDVCAATTCGTTMTQYESHSDSESEKEESKTYLDILPVRVRCNGVEVLTYALLDSGSSLSFCSRCLINALNAIESGTPTKTSLETLTTDTPTSFDTSCFDFDVLPLNDKGKFKMSKVTMIDSIPVNLSSRNVVKRLDKFDHLQGVDLPAVNGGTVTLLIGNDNALLHFPIETRAALDPSKDPQAIKTPLGWILKGPNNPGENDTEQSINLLLSGYRMPKQVCDLNELLVTNEGDVFPSPFEFDCTSVNDLMHWLKSNRELMEFGLKYSREDVLAYDLMTKSVRLVNGHFELPLLWKNDAKLMTDSFVTAKKHLIGIKRRLQRDHVLKQKYCEQMNIALANDYAEVVLDEQIDESHRVWYIPHHPVLNPRKPEKVRVVYDCAARSNHTSLNNNLMTGPDLVNKLFKVLLRFRKEKIAIVSDIEAMFYQVRVAPKDKDSLRFLWWPNGDVDLDPIPHRMKVHVFGAKSSPSCAAFALKQTAKEFGKLFSPKVSETVFKCFYVDDLLTSVSDEIGACKMIEDLTNLLKMGEFKLTKWLSTSQLVMETVPQKERAKEIKNLCLTNVENRVLGMIWNIKEDVFQFEVNAEAKLLTRRFILSITNRLFDPLGLVAPVIVEARLIFRDVCKHKIDWDDPVPQPYASRWKSWMDSLEGLSRIVIPRCFKSFDTRVNNLQLHVFADALVVARGAVCYLRVEYDNNLVSSSIVMSKAHLASSENNDNSENGIRSSSGCC